MKTTLLNNSVVYSALLILLLTGAIFAQTPETTPLKKVNFGYSQNPKTKVKKENNPQTTNREQNNSSSETIAKNTLEVVKNANKKALVPTEHYKIGVGDILFINLQNSSKGSTYYTVLNDGTIDYPLAGEMISVSGLSSTTQ